MAKPKPVKPQTTDAFSDNMIQSFKDKPFREGISPVLADMVSLLIENTVYTAVTTTVSAAIKDLKTSVIDDMIKSNKKFKILSESKIKSLKIRKNNIEDQKIMIDSTNSTIEDL